MERIESQFVFVYGTLLRGESRHALLRRCVSGPGRRARTPGFLINLGNYPALVAATRGSGAWVWGEVYALEIRADVFDELDRVEGPEYGRRVVTVELEDGTTAEAWVYVWLRSPQAGRRILSGNWRKRLVT